MTSLSYNYYFNNENRCYLQNLSQTKPMEHFFKVIFILELQNFQFHISKP